MGTGSLGTRQQPRLGGSVQYCLRDLLGLNTVCVTSVDVPMKCGAFNPILNAQNGIMVGVVNMAHYLITAGNRVSCVDVLNDLINHL